MSGFHVLQRTGKAQERPRKKELSTTGSGALYADWASFGTPRRPEDLVSSSQGSKTSSPRTASFSENHLHVRLDVTGWLPTAQATSFFRRRRLSDGDGRSEEEDAKCSCILRSFLRHQLRWRYALKAGWNKALTFSLEWTHSLIFRLHLVTHCIVERNARTLRRNFQ